MSCYQSIIPSTSYGAIGEHKKQPNLPQNIYETFPPFDKVFSEPQTLFNCNNMNAPLFSNNPCSNIGIPNQQEVSNNRETEGDDSTIVEEVMKWVGDCRLGDNQDYQESLLRISNLNSVQNKAAFFSPSQTQQLINNHPNNYLNTVATSIQQRNSPINMVYNPPNHQIFSKFYLNKLDISDKVVELKEGNNKKMVEMMRKCMELGGNRRRKKGGDKLRKFESRKLVELFGIMRRERVNEVDAKVHGQFRDLLEMMVSKGLTSNWLMLRLSDMAFLHTIYDRVFYKKIDALENTNESASTIDGKENGEGRDTRKTDLYSFICGSLLMVFASDARIASNLKTLFAFENIF